MPLLNYPIATVADTTQLDPNDFQFGIEQNVDAALTKYQGHGGMIVELPAFEGGFAVNEDKEIFEPTAPKAWTDSYQLILQADEKSKMLKDQIPSIKPFEHSMELQKSHLKYSIYTFSPAAATDDSTLSDKLYIHTGDSNNGLQVNAYVFLPLSELQLRLTGDPQSRKEAYIKDWLTFCAHRASTIVPITNSGNYIPKNSGPKWKAFQDTFDGSHLETRNNLGQHTKGAIKFLRDLLQPTPDVDTVKDIPLLIFRKWCLVAQAAGLIGKPLWSVKARFWNLPPAWAVQQQNSPLTLTYICDMPPGLYEKGLLVTPAPDSKTLVALTPKGHADKIGLEAQWRKLMSQVYDDAARVMKSGIPTGGAQDSTLKLAVPGFRFKEQKDAETGAENGPLKEFGVHPQGFYKLLVSHEDYSRLKSARPHMETHRTAKSKWSGKPEFSSYFPNRLIPSDTPMEYETVTKVTKVRVETATNSTRKITQGAVMSNVSATEEVADRAWSVNAKHVAEWLHRSAYSFGGLEDDPMEKPDNSQQAKNLVMGTYEANTSMIRFEDHIKRTAMRGTTVTVKTALLPEHTWNDETSSTVPWFVRRLKYSWEFPFQANFGATVIDKTVTRVNSFDLFAQSYPSRFEIELDAALDKLLDPQNISEQAIMAKVLYNLFLLTKA